jgi:hypothetical protein
MTPPCQFATKTKRDTLIPILFFETGFPRTVVASCYELIHVEFTYGDIYYCQDSMEINSTGSQLVAGSSQLFKESPASSSDPGKKD